MELRDLQSFLYVADYKSFTKAAEHSYSSQPSLSKAVKKLEEELHVELFDRSTRHLYLTDAGKVVYAQASKAMAPLRELPVLLDELMAVAAGTIRIGVPPLIGTLFFPQIARRFHERYPNVVLELVEDGAKVIEQLTADGSVDVGIVVLPVDEGIFDIYSFITDEFALYTHSDHPLAERQAVALSELQDEKFIVFSKNFTLHDYVLNACKKTGFNPAVSYESSQWDLIFELVASRLGVTILPKSVFQKQSNPSIIMIPLHQLLPWNLGIITKKGAYQSFALKKLLKMINEKTAFPS
ncbi:LysR family transcriptional regulator [Domibacillus indicus]|uniref:LysR family transcriptional regulator n=1 Tax=Domibacillus indicus TaxID=1437523 RepID=UPI0006182402|nr:LysR family transcriptional regulator [Domibacillus indicus]